MGQQQDAFFARPARNALPLMYLQCHVLLGNFHSYIIGWSCVHLIISNVVEHSLRQPNQQVALHAQQGLIVVIVLIYFHACQGLIL